MAVASAGPYASLQLAAVKITMPAPHHSDFYRPDALPAAQPTASIFTGRMPFLPPNQQRQCTEGDGHRQHNKLYPENTRPSRGMGLHSSVVGGPA